MIKKIFDITTIGSATIDLFFQSNRYTKKEGRLELAFGGKYQAKEFVECLGGGGLNTAVGFSRLGFKTAFLGEISTDYLGTEITKRLQLEKVVTSYSIFKGTKPSVSAILLSENGERTIVSYLSPLQTSLSNDLYKKAVLSSKWLFFCDHVSKKSQKIELLQYAKYKKTKIAVSLSSTEFKKGLEYNKQYLAYSDVFFLNARELGDLVKRKYDNLDLKTTNYADILHVDILVVTDSKKGAYAFTKNLISYQKPFPVNRIVDVTGAGDAFATGFLSIIMNKPAFKDQINSALLIGSRNAASVIQHLGAQTGLLFRREVEEEKPWASAQGSLYKRDLKK